MQFCCRPFGPTFESKKMHHHHQHGDHACAGSTDTKNLSRAFFLNLAFTIIEIIGGVWTNSVAVLADAVHDLGDSLSLGFAWYLQKFSKRKPDNQFTYGYQRFSLLGASITALVLILGGVVILSETIPRIWNPQAAHATGMIGLALLGILVNGLAVLQTQGGKSLSEQMVSLHLLEDVLGWGVVLIGAVIMYFFEVPFIDPLLSIGITLWVLYNVVRHLVKVARIFLLAVPAGVDVAEVRLILEELEGVEAIQQLQIWSLDGVEHVLTTHLRGAGILSLKELTTLKAAAMKALHPLGFKLVTIEWETNA